MKRLHENLVFALRESIDRLSGKQWARDRRETLGTLESLVDDVEREFRKVASGFPTTNEEVNAEAHPEEWASRPAIETTGGASASIPQPAPQQEAR